MAYFPQTILVWERSPPSPTSPLPPVFVVKINAWGIFKVLRSTLKPGFLVDKKQYILIHSFNKHNVLLFVNSLSSVFGVGLAHRWDVPSASSLTERIWNADHPQQLYFHMMFSNSVSLYNSDWPCSPRAMWSITLGGEVKWSNAGLKTNVISPIILIHCSVIVSTFRIPRHNSDMPGHLPLYRMSPLDRPRKKNIVVLAWGIEIAFMSLWLMSPSQAK